MSLIEDGRSVGGRGVDPDWDRDRKATVQHILVQRITYDAGDVSSEYTSPSSWLTADEALASRVKRLREAGTKYTATGRTVTYRTDEHDPEMSATVTLAFLDGAA